MGTLSPVELSFYCDVMTTEKEAFWRFVKALITVGAKPTGEASFSQPKRDGLGSYRKTRFEPNKLDEMFVSAGAEIHSLMMTNVLGLSPKNTPEKIHLTGVTPEAYELEDHGPFTLVIPGELFTEKKIPLIIKRTLQIIEAVRPHYAAFTWVDDYLMCPTDLLHMTRPFHDFYISRAFVGDAIYKKALDSYQDVYHQEFEHGLFVSTSWRRPAKPQELLEPRCDVARLIYTRWMNKKRHPGY